MSSPKTGGHDQWKDCWVFTQITGDTDWFNDQPIRPKSGVKKLTTAHQSSPCLLKKHIKPS